MIMETLGSLVKKESSNELIFETVCHTSSDGIPKDKLYYYLESKQFMCYTGCGSLDIYGVVMGAKDLNFYQSIQYVANVTNKRYTDITQNDAKHRVKEDWDIFNRFNRISRHKESYDKKIKVYDNKEMNNFMNVLHESWLKEGISPLTQTLFGIGYDWRSNKIVIPHRNIKGELVGIRGRALNKEDLENGQKYMPMFLHGNDYAHVLSTNLYGIYENFNGITKQKKLIIFEGEKSVMKFRDYLGDDCYAVAVCGSHVSPLQIDIMLKLGIDEVTLAFDKEFTKDDEISIELSRNALMKEANKLTPYFNTYVIWDSKNQLDLKDSPVDKGKEVCMNLLKNRVLVTTIKKEKEEEIEEENEI